MRLMHDPTSDSHNYLPPLKLNPTFCPRGEECVRLALSLYLSADQLKRRWKRNSLVHKNLYKKIGGWMAVVTVTPNDGVADTPDSGGHFNLWTYIGHTLEQNSALQQQLAP